MTTETPCLSGCVLSWATGDEKSAEFIDHAEGCPNAPKPAEPPACGCHGPCGSADCCERCGEPQGSEGSEPPIDWPEAEKVFCQMQSGYTYIGKGPEGYLQNAARAYLALKAERDALKAELDHLKHGIPLTYNPNTMCRDGHVMVLYVSEFEPCPMCALKARVEELEGAIVDATQRANYSAWIVLDDMANAIRARKEASNGK